MVPQLIRRQDLDVEVDFYGWCLQEADDTRVPVTFPEGFEGDVFLTALEGRLDFASAGHTHTAALAAEVWDSQPPDVDTPAQWDEVSRAQIHCFSGQLAAWSVSAGPMDGYVHLSDREGHWKVRAHCRGRHEVRRLAQEGVPEGVERYLVQFWPVGK